MTDAADDLVLSAAGTTARFDLAKGGRLASLRIDGVDVLVDAEHDAMRWGSYPMAPWAGRIRYGRFSFGGVDHQMPITLGPHAIHGTAYLASWERDGDASMAVELAAPWPFAGRLTQSAHLDEDSLRITLRLHAAEAQPAMLGWHPWFRRQLADDGPDAQVSLEMSPGAMFELDDEMIPTGRTVEPGPPPWDNCFTAMAEPPRLTWPARLELTIDTDCDYWTVFTQPTHAVCVEPQTEPPDAFNRTPRVVPAGGVLEATMTLRWRRLG